MASCQMTIAHCPGWVGGEPGKDQAFLRARRRGRFRTAVVLLAEDQKVRGGKWESRSL